MMILYLFPSPQGMDGELYDKVRNAYSLYAQIELDSSQFVKAEFDDLAEQACLVSIKSGMGCCSGSNLGTLSWWKCPLHMGVLLMQTPLCKGHCLILNRHLCEGHALGALYLELRSRRGWPGGSVF
jgi:hypothetical protein